MVGLKLKLKPAAIQPPHPPPINPTPNCNLKIKSKLPSSILEKFNTMLAKPPQPKPHYTQTKPTILKETGRKPSPKSNKNKILKETGRKPSPLITKRKKETVIDQKENTKKLGAALKSWLQNTKDESETTVSDRNRGEVAITGTISVRGQVSKRCRNST